MSKHYHANINYSLYEWRVYCNVAYFGRKQVQYVDGTFYWYVQHQHFCDLLGTLKTTFPDYVHRNGNTLRIIFPSKRICCCNYEKVISFQNVYVTTTHCFEIQHYSFQSNIPVNNLFLISNHTVWQNQRFFLKIDSIFTGETFQHFSLCFHMRSW